MIFMKMWKLFWKTRKKISKLAKLGVIATILLVSITSFSFFGSVAFVFFSKIAEQRAISLAEEFKDLVFFDRIKEEEGKSDEDTGGGGGNTVEDYEDTKNEHNAFTGDSLLTEVYNAIVKATSSVDVPGYNVEYVLGTNFRESGSLSSNTYVPYIGVPVEATKEVNFSLSKWTTLDAVKWKDSIGFDMKSYRKYIGIFQTDYLTYGTGMSTPSSSWGEAKWKEFESKTLRSLDSTNLDGNNDGRVWHMNYYDALQINQWYARSKYGTAKTYKLLTETDREDMMLMGIANHYVGILGRNNSPLFGKTSYPKDESINPHIQLLRKAITEYKNNGTYYTKFKKALLAQSSFAPHSLDSIIGEFYVANGWKKSGIGYSKAYSGGQGTLTIRGPGTGSDQDVYYAISVYWTGKITNEIIVEALEELEKSKQ